MWTFSLKNRKATTENITHTHIHKHKKRQESKKRMRNRYKQIIRENRGCKKKNPIQDYKQLDI